MIDLPVSQTEQSAEFLRPFRQPLLTDTHQGSPVMGHHRHAHLHHSAMRPFVAHLPGAACEQTGNVTFHHRAAITTGTGQLYLVRGPLAVQACLVEEAQNLLGAGLWVHGCNRLGDPDAENAARVEGLTQGGVIDPEIPGDRIDQWPLRPRHPFDGVVDFVDQGQHVTGIARVAYGHPGGKDKARGRLREDAGLATKLGWAIALAFANGGHGGIVGIDDFPVGQLFAVGQSSRLCTDLLMRPLRCAQVACQALPLGRAQRGRVLEGLLRLQRQRGDGAAHLQQLCFRLAHQLHEDFALPPALSAKAAHDFLQVVLDRVRLGRQRGGSLGALLRDVVNEVEDFFCALYRVVASVTRWLPCSAGKVSTSRCAGLTSPSSMAAAA